MSISPLNCAMPWLGETSEHARVGMWNYLVHKCEKLQALCTSIKSTLQ